MKYTKAKIGRVFLVKFDNKDILLKELDSLARKERLSAAVLLFLGALEKGMLVTGPKLPVIPPKPNQLNFKGGWETLGIGTIFTNKSGPQIHIHSTIGKKNKSFTGCVRKDSRVFLVIEAIIFELKGLKATKALDPKTGLNLLKIISA